MTSAVGIVGVGNMGGAMAARLLEQGWIVQACDLDAGKVRALERLGAVPARDAAEAAAGCTALIVCVVDAAQTEAVLFGPVGAAQAMGRDQAVLLCPTIAPQEVEALARQLEKLGIATIDAPMSGGPARARDGSMSLMVACRDDLFERHRGLIESLSNKVFRISERPGDGARTKLVNNLLAGINLVGAAEAMAMAQRMGLPLDRTLEVIEQSSGQSWIGSDRMRRAIAGDYEARAHVTLLQKDTRLAVEAGEAAGFHGPLGGAARDVFARAAAAGLAHLDDAALFKLLRGIGPAMTTILIVEDDDAIRTNIIRLLKLEGYDIVSAINGRLGLEQAVRVRPDVVISDVSMPEMDGFELLEAIRFNRDLAATSVMLLTALDDRASMRRGMTAGADDYLAKPFTRVELLDALQGLLKKKGRIQESIESAVKAREEHLRRVFTESLGGRVLHDRFGLEVPEGAIPDAVIEASVLFSDIRNFTSLAERLNSTEVAELLTKYFELTCEPVLKNGGRHLKFIGDGLMSVFADTLSGGSPLPAPRRAVSAALGMALAAHEFRAWLNQRFAHRGLPPFAIGVGLHAGEVTICRLGTAPDAETTPVGDTVNLAARLEAASNELGWTVVASHAVLGGAGEGIQTGGMTALNVRGKEQFVDVAEITGLVTNIEDMRHGMATLTERAAQVRDAVRINSEITARAVKGALHTKLAAFKDHRFAQDEEPLRLKGYRLTRKIGSGGMTQVYLALRESDGLQVVLKVLDASGKAASVHLSRFIQEYTLLSRITHPHVIRIYDQGFTDDHAYIVMEYFESGDLRAEINEGLDQQRVLAIIAQTAQALEAIHSRGIIHRDLKPENIMRRPDGTVALADFGIAKSMLQSENMALTQTRHGDVVGTPYYLSPEQAAGKPITPPSDLYSLGVMMFEMLAGERPFRAESLDLLLARHLSAPTPALPAAHSALQPVVEKLMAKGPEDRYASAQALLDDLERRSLSPAVVGPAA